MSNGGPGGQIDTPPDPTAPRGQVVSHTCELTANNTAAAAVRYTRTITTADNTTLGYAVPRTRDGYQSVPVTEQHGYNTCRDGYQSGPVATEQHGYNTLPAGQRRFENEGYAGGAHPRRPDTLEAHGGGGYSSIPASTGEASGYSSVPPSLGTTGDARDGKTFE